MAAFFVCPGHPVHLWTGFMPASGGGPEAVVGNLAPSARINPAPQKPRT